MALMLTEMLQNLIGEHIRFVFKNGESADVMLEDLILEEQVDKKGQVALITWGIKAKYNGKFVYWKWEEIDGFEEINPVEEE